MNRLESKVALITGAARGIGEAIARLFAAHGAFVYVTDIQDPAGPAVAASIGDGAAYGHLDVREEPDWLGVTERVIAERGALHVVVNNAGSPVSKTGWPLTIRNTRRLRTGVAFIEPISTECSWAASTPFGRCAARARDRSSISPPGRVWSACRVRRRTPPQNRLFAITRSLWRSTVPNRG